MNNATKFKMNIQLFQERLKALRGEKSLQAAAAELGISRATLGYYENGDRKPDIEMLLRIADHYNVSCDYLLGLTGVGSTDMDIREIAEKTGLCETAVENLTYMRINAEDPDCVYHMSDKICLSTLNSLLCESAEILENMAYYINASFDYFGDSHNEFEYIIPIADLELHDTKLGFFFTDDYDYLFQIFLIEIQRDLESLREKAQMKRLKSHDD